MKFDILDNKPCLLPQVNAESCVTSPVPTQEGRLELRPEVATVGILGTVQYRTFLIANGVEREVTSGLTYRSSSQAIALIGAIGGSATGVAEGIVTISVEWQDLEAVAQLQVVVSCDNIANGLMILLDVSESMSQAFGSGFGTKLDFGKLLAKQFAGEVNVTKDVVGLMTFAASAEEIAPLTDDNIAVANAVMGVGYLPELTDIHAGLEAAIAALTASGVARRVILLITDGQHNDDIDPIPISQQFKSAGGVIIVVGLRDGLESFIRLEAIANGGFFISAYDALTAEDAKTYVSGLKGYLCAGNCCPPGDGFVASGKLNYVDWLNWDASGYVDLIGNGFFDLIPEHGLYVDLVGSSAPWAGGLTSKETFTFINDHDYRLTYKLAGNQRADVPGYKVRVIAGSLSSVLRTMDDWRQDFTTYTDEFNGDGSTGKIAILSDAIPASFLAQSYGILLDSVQLEDLTTGEIIFMDSFDSENSTYVPPACGVGSVYGQGAGGYAYGYCCYGYGCLTEPVKQQNPDPNPPTEIENPDTPTPVSWSSTQTATATCPGGTTGADVTRSITYKSLISAADANTKALALAQAAADAALNCTFPPIVAELVNLHAFTPTFASPFSPKFGFAAIGLTADDYWNAFQYVEQPLKKSDASLSGVYLRRVTVSDFAGTGTLSVDTIIGLEHPDTMYSQGLAFFALDGSTPKIEAMFFDGLEEGSYEVYIYGHGPIDPTQVGKYFVRTGKLTGNFLAGYTLDAGTATDYGIKTTADTDEYLDTAWADGSQFVKYRVNVGAGQTGICVIAQIPTDIDLSLQLSVLMGVQIRRLQDGAVPPIPAISDLTQGNPGVDDAFSFIFDYAGRPDPEIIDFVELEANFNGAGFVSVAIIDQAPESGQITFDSGQSAGVSIVVRIRSVKDGVFSEWSNELGPVVQT